MRRTLAAAVLVLAFIVAGCGGADESEPPAAGASAVTGDLARGETVFFALRCDRCHGDSPDFGAAFSYRELEQVVRSGRGRMPAFDEAALSAADLRALGAWLRTVE